MRQRGLSFVGVALLGVFSLSCGKERLVRAPCDDDSDCDSGLLCERSECVPADTKRCEVVTEGRPLLQPSPHAVVLGALDVASTSAGLELHNLGNCTLTLFEASLRGGGASGFGCPGCAGAFPMDIFPGRKKTLALDFNAQKVGPASDGLVLLSDDGEYPELEVPLHADFIGVPVLQVAPSSVDFGFVAQGRALKRRVQLTNRGEGTAPLTVKSIALAPAGTQDFEVLPPLQEPVVLRPIAVDGSSLLAFDVQFHPRSQGKLAAELVVTTDKGEQRVPLAGDSQTAPKLSVNPEAIRLGDVPLGTTNVVPLTLVNEGGAPLTVQYAWGGGSPPGDLFAVPAVLPAIAPGAYLEVQVGMTATALGPVTGLLVLSSNDPSRPSVTVPVSANGVPGAGPAVVKVEMVFENGSDSVFDNDLRNVDLTLEHPYGYVCNKQNPKPTSWGNHGNPTWLALGLKEEPERVVLANASQDGTYRVLLQYAEDCDSLPTELLAGLLGISVDALVTYLTGGVGGGLINGKDVGQLISQVCLSRKPSAATVRVWVQGTLLHEKTVTLNKRGDTLYALDLMRAGGTFTAK